MSLTLHNTLTKSQDAFTPVNDGRVTLYTCGPTVYNYLHVGNWAAYVYWDMLVRTLIASDYKPERVMNITDVGHLVSDADDGEDKLERGARQEGKTAWEVAKHYGDDFLAGMKRLNLIAPEHTVKATDYIPQQLELVRVLKDKGYTYQIDDGIYYDTSKFPHYADFAGLDLKAQKAGARVEFNPEKRQPSDFALWKFTSEGEKRDMEWPTPVDLTDDGKERPGFPGWHLECSAMAMSILGETLDIHTGGIDHIPVHHTNEIAQSEAASGKVFSHFWLHNNHLKVNGTKISKSLGNGYTLDDIAAKGYSPMDYRMFVLQSHYRSEGNFTFENLSAAKNRLNHWRNVAELRHQLHDTLDDDKDKAVSDSSLDALHTTTEILHALQDDLNTPEALKVIDETFANLEDTGLRVLHRQAFHDLLEYIDEVLGLQLLTSTPDITDDQKALILSRERAREAKNWEDADESRDQLKQAGILLSDTEFSSVRWYRAEA